MKLIAAAALLVALVLPAYAKPQPRKRSTASVKRTPVNPLKSGAHARVSFQRAGDMRMTRDAMPRRLEPLTAAEEAAASIEKLLRGPVLRRGITGLYVADAKTGAPLFAVNANDPMNPASNVKLISTATALELLGPEFRYPTRVFGAAPVGGVVRGDLYLLGSYDPTLSVSDLHEIAASLARSGITSITGDIAVGPSPTRDGIYRSVIPIEIAAGEPGKPATAIAPVDYKLVEVEVTAKTSKRALKRPKLTYKTEVTKTEAGYPRIKLTIGGTIGKGSATTYSLWTKQRTANAAYSLIAALKAHGVTVAGEMRVIELGDFVGDTVLGGGLPVELGRHESRQLADIVRRINKWSVNWLADRVVMTAAALAKHAQPSMDLAIEAMYGWLARHANISKDQAKLDTGSGLSYRTELTPTDIVSVIRSAGGFAGAESSSAQAWLSSLAVSGTDGTLRSRFRNTNAAGHIHGKTGTLSTVIALAGILDIDPTRPLAFALVTNTDSPLPKGRVRKAHEQVVAEICRYLAKTSKTTPIETHTPVPAPPVPDGADLETEESEGEPALDVETATSK